MASVHFRWLPPLVWISPFDDLGGNLKQMLLPGSGARRQPGCRDHATDALRVLETVGHEYVRTAYAKGLADSVVVRSHILRTPGFRS